jgi:hypothetical protein
MISCKDCKHWDKTETHNGHSPCKHPSISVECDFYGTGQPVGFDGIFISTDDPYAQVRTGVNHSCLHGEEEEQNGSQM